MLESLLSETGYPDLPILEVSLKTGVRIRNFENSDRKQVMSNREKYKRAAKNDTAYNMMRMWQGAVGVVPEDGLVSPAYVVARPFQETESRYFSYLFRTVAYMNEEQRKIADFLDYHSLMVHRFIRAKHCLIELLGEQKQAIIHRAVTRGLDPNVCLKPSGIERLGDVPKNWEVIKLRRLVTLNLSKSEISIDRIHTDVVFLPMEKVSEDGKIDYTNKQKVDDVWNGFTYFRKHDVIIAKITPCFENGKGACLNTMESDFGFGSTEFFVLRAGPRIYPEYLYLITASSSFRKLGKEAMTGAAGQQRVPSGFIKNFYLSLPPLNEQTRVLSSRSRRGWSARGVE